MLRRYANPKDRRAFPKNRVCGTGYKWEKFWKRLKKGNLSSVQKSVENVDNVLLSAGCKRFIFPGDATENRPVKRQLRDKSTKSGREKEKVADDLCAKKRLDRNERKSDKKLQKTDYSMY